MLHVYRKLNVILLILLLFEAFFKPNIRDFKGFFFLKTDNIITKKKSNACTSRQANNKTTQIYT